NDLPTQWLVEEPQQTGIAGIEHTATVATTTVPKTLRSLARAASPWLREVSSIECSTTCASRRKLPGRIPTRTAGIPTTKAELSQQSLDAVVSECQADL